MPFLKKLPKDAKVFDAFQTWPNVYATWNQTCQQILRDTPSKLDAGQRELIGTYVSKLNRCHYCYSVHNAAVKEYGYAGALVDQLVDDLDGAPVDAKLKPILRYVKKLTLDHHRMVQADADAVFAAGWSDDDLHCAIAIACVFNFMNRFVHGLGIEEEASYTALAGPRLKNFGYLGSAAKRQADRVAPGAAPRAAE
jgi:uncharacterized peroxidase-related enzyme